MMTRLTRLLDIILHKSTEVQKFFLNVVVPLGTVENFNNILLSHFSVEVYNHGRFITMETINRANICVHFAKPTPNDTNAKFKTQHHKPIEPNNI